MTRTNKCTICGKEYPLLTYADMVERWRKYPDLEIVSIFCEACLEAAYEHKQSGGKK